MYIINLAFTCYGLRFIINSSVLPKFSKSLKLYLTSATSPIFDVNSSAMSVSELKAHILQIGNFVEHLSVTSVHEDQFLPVTWQHFEYILQKCQNLQTLSLHSVEFETNCLNSVTTQLKGLHLSCFIGSQDWSELLRRFSELEELSIDGIHFFSNVVGFANVCKKLSYPSVEHFW